MISTTKISIIQSLTKLLAVVLFGGAFLIFSINTLKAENGTKTFDFPETLSENDVNMIQSSNGRYQMSFQLSEDDGKAWWMILVWDTQTGASKLYSKNQEKGTIPAHSGWQLPASPL